jgi:hypothetical protein
MVKVRMLKKVGRNNMGDIRTLTKAKAEVWVNDLEIAEYVKEGKKGKYNGKSDNTAKLRSAEMG